MFKCASFDEYIHMVKEIIMYLVFSFHSYFLTPFALVELQDRDLVTARNSRMNTYGALGDLALIPPVPSLKPPEKNRGRQKMVQRASNLITFGARVSSCSLIWSQQLHALAQKVMEGIKKYDD